MQGHKKLFTGLVPTLLMLMTILLAACGPTTATPGGNEAAPVAASADKQIFRWPKGNSDYISMDPGLVQYHDSIIAVKALFSGLVGLDGKGAVVDLLAASHSVSDDGLTYTFTLRDNLKWSDGTPLTAQDVVYSINRTIDPATKSEVAFYLSAIKGFNEFQSGDVRTLIGNSLIAEGDKTVKIILGQKTGYFLASLTYTSSYAVNKKLIDKYGDKWTDHMEEGGTCGPFKVESYSHTEGLTIVPDPNYFGAKPKLQKVQFLIGGDVDVEYRSYKAGQFDYSAIPPVNLAQEEKSKDFRSIPELNTWYLALNYLTPPFDNIKIRQAFALATNKDLLNKSVNRGAHRPTNRIVPPDAIVGYDNSGIKNVDGTTTLTGNPEKAKQLLEEGIKEEGYDGVAGIPAITFTNRNQKLTQDIASALIEQWKNVLGITVKQEVLELAKFNEKITAARNNPTGAQMWFAGWGQDYPDPENWLSGFFLEGKSNNQSNYGQNETATATQQQAVQQQIALADTTVNQDERFKAYLDAEQKLLNDVAWIPLYHRNINRLINPKVIDFELTPYETLPPDAWAKVYIAE